MAATDFYRLAARTLGTTNGPVASDFVVINEIMYDPISESDDDQYVELYNRGTNAVDLSRLAFTSGINFTFPSNTIDRRQTGIWSWPRNAATVADKLCESEF